MRNSLVACFKVYSLVLMTMIASACMNEDNAWLLGRRWATRCFSDKVVGRVCTIEVASRSRHVL